MNKLAIQLGVVFATATLVLAVSGGCAQVLDINAGTLISEEAGTTVGCDPGKATCGGGATCATDLATDPANCGACGTVCPTDNASATCVDGQCKFTCTAGFDDCDKSASNACETELAETPRHCGKCGHDCFGGGCKTSVCQPRAFADSADDVRQIGLVGTSLYALAAWTLSANETTTNASSIALSPPDYFVDQFAVAGNKALAARHFANTVQITSTDGTCLFASPQAGVIAADATALYVAVNPVGPGLGTIAEVDLASNDCASPTVSHQPSTGTSPVTSITSDADYLWWSTADGTIYKYKKDGTTSVLTWVKKTPGATRLVASDSTYLYWTSTRGINRVKKLNTCDDETASCVDFFAPDGHATFSLDDQYVYVAIAGGTLGYGVSLRKKDTGENIGSILATDAVTGIASDATSIYVAAGKRVQRVAK